MQVFWDGYGLQNTRSGVAHHAWQLAKYLGPEVKPTLIAPQLQNSWQGPQLCAPSRWWGDNWKPFWPNRAFRHVRGTRAGSGEPFIYHGLSNFNLPRSLQDQAAARFVLTVHDLIPLMAPSKIGAVLYWQMRWLMPSAVRRAARVICVSEWTRERLLEFYPFAEGKTDVIANGITSQPEVWRNYEKGDGPVRTLTVSRYEPYKRLDRLVQVARLAGRDINMTVVTDSAGREYLRKLAPELVDSGHFYIHCGLSAAELSAQYCNADVYLHPSEYEGFCLPAAEALGFGVPVVYQTGSGIDEVAGPDVGVAMTPQSDGASWLEGIGRALRTRTEESYLHKLEQHISAKKSWKEAANSLKSLYERLLNSES